MSNLNRKSSNSRYATISCFQKKKIPHTKSQSHKENNHRALREHRETFSANVSFFSKPSEKHSCFSEGLLKKESRAVKPPADCPQDNPG
jgi:hypothetical protein